MERPFAFMREFDGPVHRRVVGADCGGPGRNEVVLDDSWGIRVDLDAPEAVLTAADDLADFLRVGFGLRLRRGAGRGPEIRIVAGANCSDPPCARDEGFSISVRPGGIAIRGHGPRGALHGAIKLEGLLRGRGGPFAGVGTIRMQPRFAPRVLRSYSSPYYEETIDGKSHYTDNYLARLAHLGYDAVWLRADLRELARTSVFPELGREAERNVAVLNDLIGRARRWGIGVYLYLCEPHGLRTDHPFWRRHPESRGAEGPEMGVTDYRLYAFCTSAPQVKRFIREASGSLLRHALGIEGLLLITASEHTGHCKQRPFMAGKCPRCVDRSPAEMAAEVITLIRDGVRDAGSPARIVAWNWSWDGCLGKGAEPEILRRIPADVAWMANVENGGRFERFGVKNTIHEYSLCYPGPSPVYRRKGLEARRHGHALWGKAQINVTHELASMPYMPTPFLLRDKFAGLARLGVEGIMCCWIFGGYPGVGAEQANAMMWEPFGLAEKALLDCAAGVYGRKAALPVVKAWRLFSRGYAHYPFDRGLYAHVLNDSPSHPFFFPPLRQPEGDNWRRKLSPRGDILTWCWSFTPEVTARCYRTILKSWDRAVALLRRAIRLTPPHLGREAERDLRLCEAIGIHFRSGLNYVRFIRLRDRLPDAGWPEWPKDLAERYALPPARGEARIRRILADMRQVIADEERLVASYLPMVEADSRLGYHSEGGYRFRPKDLRAKLRQLRRVRDLEIPRYERRVLG